MEDPKTSETLDKDSVVSELGEARNLCGKALEEVSGLCNLSENCPAPLSPLVASVTENGSMVDSDNKVEVSTKGISLCVEVFGTLNGHIKVDDSNCLEKHVIVENNLNQEDVCDVNGALLPENGNASVQNNYEAEGGAIDHQECRLSVDDLVWAKTKTHLWWPGVIYDASSAPKDVAKSEQNSCLLVKCSGNGNFLWCLPSQLKPFVEDFEQMAKQSNSKSFLGALDKALAEFGRRVKIKMTCSCFSKKSEESRDDLGELSVTRLEPASFIATIKHLALDVFAVPSKIDCIVIKSRLSAFYLSIGHKQIPMNQLKPTSDGKDGARAELTSGVSEGSVLEKKAEELSELFGEDANMENNNNSKECSAGNFETNTDGKSEREHESRERRKSRYLSFPYVDLNSPHVGVDMKSTNGQAAAPISICKSNGKKSQKKWSRKPITEHEVSGKSVEINTSSAEVLSELRFTALDCFHPNESKCFDSVERFLSKFRKMVFRDFISEISNEETVGHAFDHQMPPHQTFPELDVRSGNDGMENFNDVNLASGSFSMAGKHTHVQSLPDVLPKRRKRKRKEKTFLSDVKGNITSCGSVMIDFQNASHPAPEAQPMPRKRKRKAKADQGLQQIEVMVDVSGMIGNSTILDFGDPQLIGPPQNKKLEPKRRERIKSIARLPAVNGDSAQLAPMLKEVQVTGPFSIQTIPDVNNGEGIKEAGALYLNTEVTTGQPFVSGSNAEPWMGILSPGGKPEPKKRGRKKKTIDFKNEVASTIPDLNGNGIAVEGKSQKMKKRGKKNKAEAGVLFNDLQDNVEASGTALLLKFTPGYPVPSKEDLVTAFCGFGPLKESETRALSGSESAQVVFVSSSNALEAFRSLEKSSPFGPALVNFRLHHPPGSSQAVNGSKTSTKLPVLQPQQGEAPDLACIRKNLEMMTSMLEKAGNNLSPEMRAKLESEISGLMKKVSTMVGSSSSS